MRGSRDGRIKQIQAPSFLTVDHARLWKPTLRILLFSQRALRSTLLPRSVHSWRIEVDGDAAAMKSGVCFKVRAQPTHIHHGALANPAILHDSCTHPPRCFRRDRPPSLLVSFCVTRSSPEAPSLAATLFGSLNTLLLPIHFCALLFSELDDSIHNVFAFHLLRAADPATSPAAPSSTSSPKNIVTTREGSTASTSFIQHRPTRITTSTIL